MNQRIPTSKTKPELRFMGICEKRNLPFRYTGDGAFWIGRINPDFVECNGKKIAVDVFGDYWHSPLFRQDMTQTRTYEGRKKVLSMYGWGLVVFWESELKSENAEKIVLKRLNGYL